MGRSSCLLLVLLCGIFASCSNINPSTVVDSSPPVAKNEEPQINLQLEEQKEDILKEASVSPVGLKAPVPNCTAKITITTEMYSDGIREWKEFAIQVCDLFIDPERVSFSEMIGSARLGQGVLWHSLHNRDDWQVIEYRSPRTEADLERFELGGVKGLEYKMFLKEEDLPLPIQALPRDVLKEILAIIAYPNGALEILPDHQNEETVERVFNAVRKVLKEKGRK